MLSNVHFCNGRKEYESCHEFNNFPRGLFCRDQSELCENCVDVDCEYKHHAYGCTPHYVCEDCISYSKYKNERKLKRFTENLEHAIKKLENEENEVYNTKPINIQRKINERTWEIEKIQKRIDEYTD